MARKSKKDQRSQRINKLIEALKNCSDRLEIARLGQTEHDWLFANYKASSAGTFISSEYLPAIDRAFEPSSGDELLPHECWQKVNGVMVKRHLVVQTLKPTISEWVERNQPTKQSTITRINSKLPVYPKPLVSRAVLLLTSDSWAEVAAALILLTGRRPTEIAWSASFSPHSAYCLLFNGQLKKGIRQTNDFPIPTLIPANMVFCAFDYLRQLQRQNTKILNLKTVSEATKATNSQINRAIYNNFSELLDAPPDRKGHFHYLSASNLRAAYGKIAAYFFCSPESEPILFIGEILGHNTDNYDTQSLATTIHYHTYRIVDQDYQDVNELGIYRDRLKDPFGPLVTVSESEDEEDDDDNDFDESEDFEFDSAIIDLTATDITETNFVTNRTTNNPTHTVTDTTDAIPNSDLMTTKNQSPASQFESIDATVTDLALAKSGTELAERFNVSRPTIGRNRKKGREFFATWSAHADPDGTAWQFIQRGKLKSSNRFVDIYLPIERDDPIYSQLTQLNENKPSSTDKNLKQPNLTKKRTKAQSNNFQLKGYQIDRVEAIANRLGLIGNSTQQFNQLLDWAECQLHSYQPQFSSRPNNEELITKAIDTIANFSENLNNTLTPLTLELKNLIQSHSEPKPLPEDIETEIQCLAEAEQISSVKQNPEIEPLPTAVQDTSCVDTPEVAPATKDNGLRTFLDPDAISSTIDSLHTSIALKRSAIATEKKKRSKSDTATIKQWQREIERLEKSIDFLSQLEPR